MPEKGSNWRHTRRRFLTATGAATTALVAGCVGGDDDDDSIDWVMNPAEETIDIEVQYQPLFTAIEDEFDVEINGMPTESYAGTTEELERAGEGDRVFADTSPGAVPQLGDEIDVVGMREAFGSELYFGTLVTLAETDIYDVSDLEGELVVTGSVGSVSGGMAPLWMLQDGGLDIGNAPDGGDAEDFDHIGGVAHDLAVEELIEDPDIMAAGAGEFVTVPHVPAEQLEDEFPDLADISPDMEIAGTREPEMRMVETSPPIPRAPIIVNGAWESDLRDDIMQFMVDAETELFQHDAFDLAEEIDLDLPEEMLEDESEGELADDPAEAYDLDESQQDDWQEFQDHELWFSGIVEATHEDYDPVQDFADDLGLAFADI